MELDLIKAIAVALLLYSLFGCSPDKGGGTSNPSPQCSDVAFQGTWQNEDLSTDFLNITDSCIATATYCNSVLEFTVPNGTNSTVTVTQTNGNVGCMELGTYQCFVDMESDGSRLYVDCGGSDFAIYRPEGP